MSQLAWSPDGKKIAIAGSSVGLWQPGLGYQLLPEFAGRNVAWSRPDGAWLAASAIGGVRFWQTARATTSRPIPADGSLSWSQDGAILAVGTLGGSIQLWDRATMQQRLALLALGKEGQWLAVGSGGHYRGSEGIEKYLRVVVETDKGQDTHTLNEFSAKYNWHNDSKRVQLHGR